MALFRNFSVNQTKDVTGPAELLVGRTEPSASAQFLDFLELAEICAFLDWKPISAHNETMDGHWLRVLNDNYY